MWMAACCASRLLITSSTAAGPVRKPGTGGRNAAASARASSVAKRKVLPLRERVAPPTKRRIPPIALRNIATGLPVIGMTPVLVAPIFKPPYALLLAHIVLALGTTWWILKQNARWFAAHLEEL